MRRIYLICLAFMLIVSPSFLEGSWEALNIPTKIGFGKVCAINEQTIFVWGAKGLWKTFNGKDWLLDSNYSPGQILYFVDDTLGFLSGYVITTDGGKTWQTGDTVNGIVGNISFPKNQNLIGYGDAYDDVRKTTDGGWHWKELPPFPKLFPGYEQDIFPKDVCFPTVDTGYVLAEILKVLTRDPYNVEAHYGYFKTTDGGQSWVVNREVMNDSTFNPYEMSFPENASVGYMAGGSCKGGGRLFKTTNGGITWDTVLNYSPYRQTIYSISFPETDKVGYVFGDSVAHRTTDGGKTWQTVRITHDSTFFRCYFINNRVGFITGHNNDSDVFISSLNSAHPYIPGFVLKTTDGLFGIEEDYTELESSKLIEASVPAIFNNNLAIRYNVEEPGEIRASLYNVSGVLMQSLAPINTTSLTGVLNFNAEYPSGVYFVKLDFCCSKGRQSKTLKTISIR